MVGGTFDFLKTDTELEARPPTNTDRYWLRLPLVSLFLSHPTWLLRFLELPPTKIQPGEGHWPSG